MTILKKYRDGFIMITIFLATVTIAFVSYCATLWSSNAQELYSKANRINIQASSVYLQYLQELGLYEMQEIKSGVFSDNTFTTNNDKKQEKLDTIMESYHVTVRMAQEAMNNADNANEKGDTFSLLGFLCSIVLFLTSMIQIITLEELKNCYLLISMTLLVGITTMLFFVQLPI